jgi:hypothetical protein
MDPTIEMLECVCDLVRMFPGVTVVSRSNEGAVARIVFEVRTQESARALQWASVGANVPIEPWEKGLLVPSTYAFVAPTEDVDGFSDLKFLGIHLTWELHKRAWLPTSQANHLLRQWRAAEVGG